MKLSELSKAELCELVKQLLRRPNFIIKDCVHRFLLARWNKKFDELMKESENYIGIEYCVEWGKVQQKIDKLQNNMDYYCELDEFRGEE